MATKFNARRLIYVVRRLKESPIQFLIRKIWILFGKKIAFLPKSPLLSLFQYIVTYRLVKHSKKLNDLDLTIGAFSAESELKIVNLKNEVENGTYQCLGYGSVDIIGENTFHTDCIHGYTWPNKHFSKIDFVCSDIKADVKIPWEKSRLQWLLVLTSYHSSHGSLREYKTEVLKHIFRWKKQNEFLMGVNWCSSMEVAVRAINIVLIYRLLLPHLTNTEKSKILESIAQHKIYLYLFPEISDIPGNHYLATEVGAFITGTLINKSEKQLAKRMLHLNKVFAQQFNSDGMHIEFAPMYHRLCLDFVLVSYLFAAEQKVPLQELEKIEGTIKKAVEALKVVSSENGKIAIFGDNDSGQILWFGQDARDASLYVKGKNKEKVLTSCCLLKEFYFYSFPDALTNIESLITMLNKEKTERYSAYPFHTINAGSFKLITRVGKLGLGERGAHDHDDNLSYWVFDEDDDVIIEQGCAPYTLSVEEREACISSSAHNVITPRKGERFNLVDGSIFKTVRGAKVSTIVSQSDSAIHGRMTIENYSHERIFSSCEQTLVINERVKGEKQHLDSYIYIYSRAVKVEPCGKFSFTSLKGKEYFLDFGSVEDKNIEILDSYYFPNYGETESIIVLKSLFNFGTPRLELKISKA
ncbi:heparinase II/III domain-containing protein [Thalassotalea sp. PLHSN55]|uniref:heparinase II/III domain-containing protein n=1 Tax=Thalassotalea sp. PLHSN55 TaxID=3435888 RepID=UPI003F82FE06